jgi:hypothetical protein
MTFGLSAAAMVGVAGVATAGATIYAGSKAASAAKKAAGTQAESAQLGIDEQRRQFDLTQKLLGPYAQAGEGALSAQQALIGLAGPEAQAEAIRNIEMSPQFTSMVAQGENAMLQNASATGGLRGGNTQAALAQFRPNLLSGLIQQQYQNLGGLTTTGANAAAGVGSAGMQTGANVSNLLQQQGAATAGGQLAAGQSFLPQAIASGLGVFSGLGGTFGAPAAPGYAAPSVIPQPSFNPANYNVPPIKL